MDIVSIPISIEKYAAQLHKMASHQPEAIAKPKILDDDQRSNGPALQNGSLTISSNDETHIVWLYQIALCQAQR